MAYVIIVETKNEEPLVMEHYLSKASYEAVYNRYQGLMKSPDVVRVCMAKLVFEIGNKTLLPESE